MFIFRYPSGNETIAMAIHGRGKALSILSSGCRAKGAKFMETYGNSTWLGKPQRCVGFHGGKYLVLRCFSWKILWKLIVWRYLQGESSLGTSWNQRRLVQCQFECQKVSDVLIFNNMRGLGSGAVGMVQLDAHVEYQILCGFFMMEVLTTHPVLSPQYIVGVCWTFTLCALENRISKRRLDSTEVLNLCGYIHNELVLTNRPGQVFQTGKRNWPDIPR